MIPGLILLTGLCGPAAATAEFTPKVDEVAPAVRENFDLDLFTAGSGGDCFKRAMQLRGSLADLSSLNPMHDTESLLNWLAVTALLEAAVGKGGDQSSAWELELSRVYREWNRSEQSFLSLRSAMELLSFQPGYQEHPLVLLSVQLVKLPAYARQGIHWIAKRKLKDAGPQLRLGLLEGLVDVCRREADFQGMWMAAQSLSDQNPGKGYAVFEAEALFELGKSEEAEKALTRAGKLADPEDLKRAKQRKQLAEARLRQAKQPVAGNLLAIGRVLLDLGEPWRVRQELSVEQLLRLADPKLDELYIQAEMTSGLNYRSAWDFGKRARGRPATRRFLAHRISAGLMAAISRFYSRSQGLKLDPETIERIQKDLADFRPADPRLADLTSLYLDFLRFISVQDGRARAGQALKKAVVDFNRANPADPAGVQMVYLLAQLDKQGPDPWEALSRFFQARGNRDAPAILPVYAGAAVRKSMVSGSQEPVGQVLDWIDKLPEKSKTLSMGLWRAHLKTVQAMLVEEKSLSARLLEATRLYGAFIQAWSGASSEAQGAAEEFCDAAVSLAVLLMQGQASEQGRDLMKQIQPVCGSYPPAAAVTAVMDLAGGEKPKEGEADPRTTLEETIPQLFSEQAKLQARLWLAVAAEAAGDADVARKHLQAAAGMVLAERERGVQMPLAPDRRSLVAFSGAFNMGAGYSDQSPFGLTIEVSIVTRMALFPPAAVSGDKLKPYLQSDSKKQP